MHLLPLVSSVFIVHLYRHDVLFFVLNFSPYYQIIIYFYPLFIFPFAMHRVYFLSLLSPFFIINISFLYFHHSSQSTGVDGVLVPRNVGRVHWHHHGHRAGVCGRGICATDQGCHLLGSASRLPGIVRFRGLF